MHMLQSLFYLTIALHVSGIIITHLQEHKTTVTTASGNRYTVIDRVKFLLLESTNRLDHQHHHHVQEGLGLMPVPCILKMKLVPPSLPRSSYVSSSFWFIL